MSAYKLLFLDADETLFDFKPAERSALAKAFDQYRLEKGAILMNGDGLSSDIQGGVNFGIETCWVNLSKAENPTGLRPTFEVHSLKELKTIL
jgi:FMN phosphatase YigB (HAD superfamily)